jgi:glycosyltransferase involved in cell wall biosynthesis
VPEVANGRASARSAALQGPGIRVACFPSYDGAGQNAYLSLLYEHLAELGLVVFLKADFTFRWLWRHHRDVTFLHFHWQPDWYYAVKRKSYALSRPRLPRLRSWLMLVGFAARLAFARLLGYRIVWTIHETYPPTVMRERTVGRRIDRIGQGLLARCSHVLVAHDRAVAERTAAELGLAPESIAIVPHGPYFDVYPVGRARSAVRSELDIPLDAFVFLAFGSLRNDKSIDLLLEAFASIDDPNVMLVVAGRVEDPDSLRSVRDAAAADPRIKPLLRFVPSDGVEELFRAADAGVLARGEAWTSGSLILSISMGLPVVAARLPAHERLLGEGAGWLFEPNDAGSLASALIESASTGTDALWTRRAAARAAANALPTWHEIATQLADLMLSSIDSPAELDDLVMRTWPVLESGMPTEPAFPPIGRPHPEPAAPGAPDPAVAPASPATPAPAVGHMTTAGGG